MARIWSEGFEVNPQTEPGHVIVTDDRFNSEDFETVVTETALTILIELRRKSARWGLPTEISVSPN